LKHSGEILKYQEVKKQAWRRRGFAAGLPQHGCGTSTALALSVY
jgi:hypothetical protein